MFRQLVDFIESLPDGYGNDATWEQVCRYGQAFRMKIAARSVDLPLSFSETCCSP